MALPIGGFMPIPLAMMIPFMATQSMVMGDAFGRAFQYGKRKISAMSNEEFNKTSLEQQASEMFAAYKIIIGENHLRDAIRESNDLQKVIIQEMLLILPRFTADTITDIVGKTDIKDTQQDIIAPTSIGGLSDRRNTTATITGNITFWVYTPTGARPSTTSIQAFLKKAYPKEVTITGIRIGGSVSISTGALYLGKQYQTKHMYLISYKSSFPLPKTITVTQENLADL